MSFEEEFRLFYYGDGDGGYPRKKAPRDAEKAFRSARRRASLEEIVEGRKRFVKAQPWGNEIQFCPYPATWLNRDQFRDEYEEPKLEYQLTDRQRLVAFIMRGTWDDNAPISRPANKEEAKARLEAMRPYQEYEDRLRIVK